MELSLKINGVNYIRSINPSMTLLDFIREEVNLTGTKKGCDLGECGVCTIHLNGRPILSCLMLAVEAQGKEVTTIEGVGTNGKYHPVQIAMVEEGAIQCGYCTPAMVMNGVYLYNQKNKQNVKITPMEIKQCVSGTICRCTGYTKIEKAFAVAMEKGTA